MAKKADIKTIKSIGRVLCLVKNKKRILKKDIVVRTVLLTNKYIKFKQKSKKFGDIEPQLTDKGKRMVRVFRC